METGRRRPFFLEDIVVLDVETGGIDPSRCALLEVAAARWDASSRRWSFWHTYHTPDGDVDREALDINRLDPERLEAFGAVCAFRPLVKLFSNFCCPEGRRFVWAGHNVRFDIDFIRRRFDAESEPFPNCDFHVVDTGSISAFLRVQGLLPSASLSAACSELGVRDMPTHCAMDDVLACKSLLEAYMGCLSFDLTSTGIPY